MFPIIPSHILRQTAPVNRSPLSGEHNLWTVWTDSLLNRSDFAQTCRDVNVEQPTPECASESESESDRLISAPGCFSSVLIPKDSRSYGVENYEMYAPGHDTLGKHYRLRLNASGSLKADGNVPDCEWIKAVRLSDDTQSNNAILETTNDRQLRVRIIQTVQAGEEIRMWFSEEILALMYIPFLTPANIRGKNCYTCNVCEKTYETPNPLKIHLATNCNRHSQNELWTRLNQSASKQQFPYHPPYVPPEYALLQHRFLNGATLPAEPAFRNRPSAFHPVNTPRHPLPPTERMLVQPQDKAVANAAAHLETIVSNMGTSKQGHLCIYCGKLYSRKYGLKIHIRTHTGFKPLKCKYCYRPFGDPSNLNKHVRLHVQSNTLYKCNICAKILVRRRDLQRHMQTRHHQTDVEMDTTIESSSSNVSSSSSDDDDSKYKDK